MARDPHVCVMGEDVGQYGGSYKVSMDLYDKYGELRVLDTPIAENAFTGMAVGAAMTGLRPIVEGMVWAFCCSPSIRSPTTWGCFATRAAATSRFPPWCVAPVVSAVSSGLSTARGRGLLPCRARHQDRGLQHPHQRQGPDEGRHRDNNPVLFFEHVLLYNLSEELPGGTTPALSIKRISSRRVVT